MGHMPRLMTEFSALRGFTADTAHEVETLMQAMNDAAHANWASKAH